MIRIRGPRDDDRAEWLRMRKVLWADCPDEEHAREINEYLLSGAGPVFLAERPEGGLCGFLEAAIRAWAEGCEHRPVGYIEGWYVDEDVRRQGIGKALVAEAEAWARSSGCRQIASDAELWNTISLHAHQALGYEEIVRQVHFKKDLDGQASSAGPREVPLV